ncbi:MAG TPA: FkbM family methyltransferase [Vicinamibacterales bacterium]
MFARAFDGLKRTALAWELRRLRQVVRGETPLQVEERRFYTSVIPNGATGGCIVDVGGNTGSKAEIFRQLARRVIVIEPDPASAETLRRRFRWRKVVTIRECAVTDHTGSVVFYQFTPGSAYNTADPIWVAAMMDGSNHMRMTLTTPQEIRVNAVTLSEIVAEYAPIKYVKIDVEGHEEQALSTLDYPVPLISMEFNLPQMFQALSACLERLEQLGQYEFNAVITEPPRRFELEWLSRSDAVTAIRTRGWGYAEVYARLKTTDG